MYARCAEAEQEATAQELLALRTVQAGSVLAVIRAGTYSTLYGKLRLNRVCRHYGEVAGFDRGGRAAYSRRELRAWADSIGLKYV